MKQVYKKYNSFVGLRLKKKYDKNDFLNNLKLILDDEKNLVNLDHYYLKVLDYIKKDLFYSGTEGRPKFDL